jgi:alkanesulfonate monooxygenase SsuD/methylene tetrahydromethanopterin reductase-like flavin-dependent oxidoreductase (luciferase family)
VDGGLPAFRRQVLYDRRAHQRAERRPEASPFVLDRGGGEKVTLRLVAKWGDACNVAGSVPADVDTIRHKLDVLKRHCDDLGRDYDEIIKSTNADIHVVDDMNEAERATVDARGDKSYDVYAKGTIVGTPEMIRERLQPVIDAGIDYFIVTIPREAHDQDAVRRFAHEVIPLFG